MTLATCLRSLKTRFDGNQPRRTGRRPASHKPATAKPRMEPLEERIALSGFGPEDGAYIVEPWYGRYEDVKIQPSDQKILAAGRVQSTGGVAIARYDSAGNPDTGYGSGGLSTPTGGIARPFAGLTLQPDGKAVVPATTGNGYFGAARFKTNGSLDSSFGNGGWSGVSVSLNMQVPQDIGLQSTGKIVVGGYTLIGGNVSGESAALARFTTSGSVDSGKGGFGQVLQGGKATGYTISTFGAQLAEFKGLAIQPDDKVVAIGFFSPTGSLDGQLIVARYTAAGTLDTTFNGSGYSVLNLPGIAYTSRWFEANGVALQSDGKIVVASTSAGMDGSSDMLVVRYNPSGRLDPSFGGGTGYVRLDIDGTASNTYETGADVAIQPDGRIVVAGFECLNVSGAPGNVLVARFNADGTPDATFGVGGFKLGTPPAGPDYHSFVGAAVALQSDGSLIVAGFDDWDSTGTVAPHPLLMRFFPTSSSSLMASSEAAPAASNTQPLTVAQVQPRLTAGITRSQAAGATGSGLGSLEVRIINLTDATLDLSSGNTISLDSNAADWSWSVVRSSRRGRVPQAGRMDLLSALTTRAV